ncbi:CI repressor [Nitrosococcus halophilus Nc 4]|uniref:CI repressor n=2 Tax=Nitrosococcus halophilus TaxID=133539 RepID=D5BYG1_NITHN|nr:CI repressor [Nitrosococcus halophilus Nc 4]
MLDDKDVAKRLRQAMDETGVSNAKLATNLDMSLQAIGGWLKTGKIARDRLPGIRAALGISIDWLLTGQGSMRLSDTESLLTPQQREVLNLFESLTDRQQKDFLESMREAKRKNEELYFELKSKYEQDQRLTKKKSSKPNASQERRSGKERRRNVQEVDFERRSGLDRRKDKGVILGPGESIEDFFRDEIKKRDDGDDGPTK